MPETKKLKQGDRVEIVATVWEKHITRGQWRAALPCRGIVVEVRESPGGQYTVGEVIDTDPHFLIRTPRGVIYELTIGDTVRVMDPVEVLAMLG